MTTLDLDVPPSAASSDRSLTNLVYILYIAGFFTGITALIGVIIAYVNRDEATEFGRSHYDHQIKIFWRGVMLLALATVLYFVCAVAAVMTLGMGAVLMVLPFGIMVYWMVWTLVRAIKGMKAVSRQQAI